MLTEMTEYECKIKEELNAIQSEIKKNIQGTKEKGRKLGFKSMLFSFWHPYDSDVGMFEDVTEAP